MRILIVEDEEMAARRLKRLVCSILGNAVVSIQNVFTLSEAICVLDHETIDLAFLDLDLSGDDGFEVLRTSQLDMQVIVVSANIHRAIHAFEKEVLDFVPKPVEKARLESAIQRVKKNNPERIILKSISETEIVELDKIVSFSGAGDYVELHLENGRKLLHYDSLDNLESSLPKSFLRTHRSHIANLDFVSRLGKDVMDRVVLESKIGTQVPVSRRRVSAVKKFFDSVL